MITSYGEHFTGERGSGERLLDYCAECCGCPTGCPPEWNLATMTGEPMTVCGSKRVHYTFPEGR